MRKTRLAVIQMLPDLNDPVKNAEKICRFLRGAAEQHADLALFPEACLTGYSSALAEKLAIPADHRAVRMVEAESLRTGAAVCFGYYEETGALPFITQEFFSEGTRTLYRKTHLGSREQGRFQAGRLFPAADLRKDPSLRCGMQLCWESHIPDISTALRAQGAELLLFPYASGMGGETCRAHWSHLPARASDNGLYAAACNALQRKNRGDIPAASADDITGGGIAVYDPKGRCIASCFDTDERMLLCDLAGPLPREIPDGDMHSISYFDRRRTELF